MTTAPAALSRITVLDLTRLLPGAFCTQMLADLGAEVIKIEHPEGGDYNRAFAPMAKTESGSFLLLNRNKKSLTLNLKQPEAIRILLRLARGADVLIEGFRPGVMDRLGLSYDVLKRENPGIIVCAISGYGQNGPNRLKPGHDLNYMAESGALQLFGTTATGPIVPGLSIADVGGGSLMASNAILAALIARGRTGEGQYIDISMHDGAIAWLGLHGADRLFAGIEPRGGERPFIGQAPCYNVYRCADGRHVALGIIEDHFWHRFCDAVDLPALKADQWPVGAARDNQFEALAALFASRARDEWVQFLEPADIPFGPVLDMDEALHHPHAAERRMLLEIEHPREGSIPQLGFPMKLSRTPCVLRSPPPLLGEHNDEILAGLGYDPAGRRRLKTERTI